jgi:hypothetical protein
VKLRPARPLFSFFEGAFFGILAIGIVRYRLSSILKVKQMIRRFLVFCSQSARAKRAHCTIDVTGRLTCILPHRRFRLNTGREASETLTASVKLARARNDRKLRSLRGARQRVPLYTSDSLCDDGGTVGRPASGQGWKTKQAAGASVRSAAGQGGQRGERGPLTRPVPIQGRQSPSKDGRPEGAGDRCKPCSGSVTPHQPPLEWP